MSNHTYFIRPDYVANPPMVPQASRAHASLDAYWNADRIDASRHYQYSVYRRVARFLSKHPTATVVDVGCGVGSKLAVLHTRFPKATFVGLDQDETIAFCRRTYDFGTWMAVDLDAPVAYSGPLGDIVVCADVIEHLANPDRLLELVKTCLAPRGRVLLSTPDRDRLHGPGCLRSVNPAHVREWNAKELQLYLMNRGFEIVEHAHDLPVRLAWSRFAYRELAKRVFRGRQLFYNQVCTLRVPV